MKRIDYLPLGSVVTLKGSQAKYILVGRGLQVRHPKTREIVFFDYAAVPYPQGLTGIQVMYLPHGDIGKVVYQGYSDQEDRAAADSINEFLETHPDTVRAKG